MLKRVREIYLYRSMISSLVGRDLKGRYLDSFLGVLWNFLSPLLQLLVYTFVFSKVMRMGLENYYMFLFVALMPWIFFSSCLTSGSSCVLAQQDMVKKIYFPREVLPISFVTAQFVNMLLCFVVIFAVLLINHFKMNIEALLYLPLIMLIEFILALGCVLILSSLTVFFRDLQHIMGIVAMALQFLSPVMYSDDLVPTEVLPLFNLNPMSHVLRAYRDILYYARVPNLITLKMAIILGIVTFVLGEVIFSFAQKHFIEVL